MAKLQNHEISRGISLGYNEKNRALIRHLFAYEFIIEKTQSKESMRFLRTTAKSLEWCEAYNKPFLITEGMITGLHRIRNRLLQKLSEFHGYQLWA